jgi:hypothetical protein
MAKVKLARAAERTGNTQYLPVWLERLDAIHERRMAEAREWVQKPSKLPTLTEANVSTGAVTQVAINSVAEAQQEDPND